MKFVNESGTIVEAVAPVVMVARPSDPTNETTLISTGMVDTVDEVEDAAVDVEAALTIIEDEILVGVIVDEVVLQEVEVEVEEIMVMGDVARPPRVEGLRPRDEVVVVAVAVVVAALRFPLVRDPVHLLDPHMAVLVPALHPAHPLLPVAVEPVLHPILAHGHDHRLPSPPNKIKIEIVFDRKKVVVAVQVLVRHPAPPQEAARNGSGLDHTLALLLPHLDVVLAPLSADHLALREKALHKGPPYHHREDLDFQDHARGHLPAQNGVDEALLPTVGITVMGIAGAVGVVDLPSVMYDEDARHPAAVVGLIHHQGDSNVADPDLEHDLVRLREWMSMSPRGNPRG